MSNHEDVSNITFSAKQVAALLEEIADGLKKGKEVAVSAQMILTHGEKGLIKYEIITSKPLGE